MNSTKWKIGALMALTGAALLAGGCAPGDTNTAKSGGQPACCASGKLKVVATNSIIADMAEEIGKDKADVYSIVPRGKDPHEYEPLPEDVKQVTNGDVIFYNGINLETGGNAWFSKMLTNAGKTEGKEAFAVSDGVEVIYLEVETEQGKEDPHAWLDIGNGILYAKNIEKHMSEKDPANEKVYKANLDAYVKKLTALNKEAKEKLAAIPKEKRLIVTSEGCFKYFSKAYDVPSAYIWEINTEEEGTPAQVRDLLTKLAASEVPSLFVETSVNPQPMKTISSESGIPIYAKLFTDSAAEKGEVGDSYYAMMKWNVDHIAAGLEK